MAEVQETQVQETPAAVKGKGKAAVEETPAVNGDAEQKENGHSNGHSEDPAAENGDSEEAPAAGEPPVKKVKKLGKEKSSGNRRSSSRLTNAATGTKLSSEISSDNLPKGC